MNATRIRRVARYLPVLVRGRPLHSRERYAPFFIVGSGRCGTTLLRAILEVHPVVHIPPESHVLGRVIGEYRRFSRLPWNVVLRIVLAAFEYHEGWDMFELTLGAVFRELETRPPAARDLAAVVDAAYRAHARKHKPSASRWGDKSWLNTFSLPALRSVFPDLRVVHLVRDGRDVAASFARLVPDGLVRFARHWVRAVESAQTFGRRHPSQYLEIRYEDLVRRPVETVRNVTAFLALDFEESLLRYHELGLWMGDVDRVPHLRGARQPIDATRIGGWRAGLDALQIAELERFLRPTLAKLGYGDAS